MPVRANWWIAVESLLFLVDLPRYSIVGIGIIIGIILLSGLDFQFLPSHMLVLTSCIYFEALFLDAYMFIIAIYSGCISAFIIMRYPFLTSVDRI